MRYYVLGMHFFTMVARRPAISIIWRLGQRAAAALFLLALSNGLLSGVTPCSNVFRTGTPYATDTWPNRIAKGDINNDGKLDVVSVSFETGSLSALLGRGDGTFEDVRISAGIGRATGITLGDVDNDGKLDAAVIANAGPDYRVTIHRGDGAGSFSPLSFKTGYNPQDARLVDLDADGLLDLVVTWGDLYVGKFETYKGMGDGNFGAAAVYDLSHGVGNRLAIADLNSDGRPDIAFSCSGFIDVWLGDGTGAMQRSGWSSQNYGGTLYAGELGYGSSVDLILVDNTFNKVYLFSGNGDGSFTRRGNFAVGNGPGNASIADVDLDGKNDIVTSNHESNEISVLLAKGDGDFSKAVHYSTSPSVGSLLIDDFDNDGKPDAVTSGYRTVTQPDSQVRFTRGLGDGRFSAPVRHELYQYSHPNTVAIGDLNGDGQGDVVVGNSGQADMFTAGISVFIRNGDMRLGARRDHVIGYYVNRVEIKDANLDGVPDIVGVGEKHAHVLLGDGTGGFTAQPPMMINPQGGDIWAISLAVERFDSDEWPDMVLGDRLGSVYIARGLGSGTFQNFVHAYRDLNLPFVVDLAATDLNGDGRLDLALLTDTGFDAWAKVQILVNTGNGFTLGDTYHIGQSYHPAAIVAADLDGDATTDLAVTVDYNAGMAAYVQFYKGLGAARFSPSPTRISLPDLQPRDMAAADLNSDGILDLAVTYDLAENVTFLEGLGNATFRVAQKALVGGQSKRMALGHLNNDSSLDIVVANNGADSISVIQNSCNSAPDARYVSVSGRVISPDGRALRNVVVTLIDGVDPPRTATTSSFGIYSFPKVWTTSSYVLTANSKRYRFAPRTVVPQQALSDLDLVGME